MSKVWGIWGASRCILSHCASVGVLAFVGVCAAPAVSLAQDPTPSPLTEEQMLEKSKEQSVGDAAQQPMELKRQDGDGFGAQADYRYEVNVPGDGVWATIRNTTNGFTMGNGRDGWTFDVTYRSSNFTYYYGWL